MCRHANGDQYPVVNMTVHWRDLGYEASTKAAVRDLFAREDLGVFQEKVSLAVDLHDARMVKVSPENHRTHYEDWRPWNAKYDGLLQAV